METHRYKLAGWTLQISTWVFFLMVAFSESPDPKVKDKDYSLVYCFIFCYLAYCVIEFRSVTLRYIKSKGIAALMHQKMGLYFRAFPEIRFFGQCFHYRFGSNRREVTTHTEHYTLPYYSARDVSGLFYLNVDQAKARAKHYIQLDLYEEVNFADAISYMDYMYQKDLFWRRNRFRDERFYFQESRVIPGMERNNLIRLTVDEPCCVNRAIYIFLTLLTLVEFYKLYFDRLCVKQVFKIRKLVSTRYDLNQSIYQYYIPQINLITQQYNYNPEDYNFINEKYQVQAPTAQELEMAKQYQNKVPNYQISSGNGQIHAGVIIDDPNYCSFNAQEPPPAFANMGCNVALNKNQINTNGDLPPQYNYDNRQVYIEDNQNVDVSNNKFALNNGTITQENNLNNLNNLNNQKIHMKRNKHLNINSTIRKMNSKGQSIKDKIKKTSHKKK